MTIFFVYVIWSVASVTYMGQASGARISSDDLDHVRDFEYDRIIIWRGEHLGFLK